jgi:uncharacterized protein
MLLVRCPICDQLFDPEHSDSVPFCSQRCRRVDLGRWLDERYSLPIEREHDHEAEERADPPD